MKLLIVFLAAIIVLASAKQKGRPNEPKLEEIYKEPLEKNLKEEKGSIRIPKRRFFSLFTMFVMFAIDAYNKNEGKFVQEYNNLMDFLNKHESLLDFDLG